MGSVGNLTLEDIDNMTVVECQAVLDAWPKTPKGQLKGTRGNPELGGLGFALRGKVKHNGSYKYKDVEYTQVRNKVKLLCPEHGEFLQRPDNHVNEGNGCAQCHSNIGNDLTRYLLEFKEVHGDKYTYDKITAITSNKDKVTVTCPLHGGFYTSVNNHKSGHGCPSCVGQSSTLIYLWKVVGYPTYKLGISTPNRYLTRIAEVERAHGVVAKLLAYKDLGTSAKSLERELHSQTRGYQSKLITSGDGYTEFFDLPDDLVVDLIEEIMNDCK